MSFQNEKGSLIVDYLKQRALDEDLEGSTAFYIVRTKENDVLKQKNCWNPQWFQQNSKFGNGERWHLPSS